MLLADISSGAYALLGALLGGAISLVVSVHTNRVSVISKLKNEWVNEFRNQFIQLIVAISAVRKEFDEPEERVHIHEQKEQIERRDRMEARMSELRSRINLHLSTDTNNTHRELFDCLSKLCRIVLKRPGTDENEYPTLFRNAHKFARAIIAEEMKQLEKALSAPWADL